MTPRSPWLLSNSNVFSWMFMWGEKRDTALMNFCHRFPLREPTGVQIFSEVINSTAPSDKTMTQRAVMRWSCSHSLSWTCASKGQKKKKNLASVSHTEGLLAICRSEGVILYISTGKESFLLVGWMSSLLNQWKKLHTSWAYLLINTMNSSAEGQNQHQFKHEWFGLKVYSNLIYQS